MSLPTASDNKFPKVIFKEQDPVTPPDVATPAANHWALFMGDDGELYVMDDGGTITQLSGGSATLGDGDYGDITVGSSGTTLTIDNDAVTYAKIQNVSATDRLLGRDTAGAGDIEELSLSGGLEFTGSSGVRIADAGVTVAKLATGAKTGTMLVTFDGGGSAITTGVKGDLHVPIAVTITKATLLADQSGSIVIDIWKDSYANFPPTNADTITASAKPTLSGAAKSQDSTLTGWTTSVSAGDVLRFNVDSASTVTRVLLALEYTKA